MQLWWLIQRLEHRQYRISDYHLINWYLKRLKKAAYNFRLKVIMSLSRWRSTVELLRIDTKSIVKWSVSNKNRDLYN